MEISELPPLSRAQRECLSAIRRFLDREGFPPSFRDVAAEMGVTSTSTVHYHMNGLKQKGYLDYSPTLNRSIVLKIPTAAPQVPGAGPPPMDPEKVESLWKKKARHHEKALERIMAVRYSGYKTPIQIANEAILLAVEALGVKDFQRYLIPEE